MLTSNPSADTGNGIAAGRKNHASFRPAKVRDDSGQYCSESDKREVGCRTWVGGEDKVGGWEKVCKFAFPRRFRMRRVADSNFCVLARGVGGRLFVCRRRCNTRQCVRFVAG